MFVSRIALTAAFFAVPLVMSAPAMAQAADPAVADEPAFTDGAATGDIIVTAQRRNQTEVSRRGNLGALGDQDAANTPFSIRSYNEALILNQQPQTLGQVLENDPSVRTTYGFGTAAEQFVIRGFILNGDDIGMNGLYGIAPRQLVAPELYDSVQVLNGASAFLYGAAPGGSGIGGSVNLVFKRAQRDLLRATVNYTSSSHIGGSFDFGRRFGDNNEWGVRINGAFRSGDVAIDGEFRQTAVIGGSFDYNSGPIRLSLDLAYQNVRLEGLRPKVTVVDAIPAPPEPTHNYGQPWTYSELRDVFGIVRFEYDFAPEATFYASFGARDGSEESINDGLTITNAITGAATSGNVAFVPRTDNNEAAEAGIRVRLSGGGITHQVNFGGSMSWQVNRNAFDFFAANYLTNLYDTPVVPIPGTGFVGGNLADPFPLARTRLSSAFASDTIGFWGDRILVTAGVRLQQINVHSYNYYNGGQLDSEYDESAITPVFGIVFRPTENLSFFANRIQGLAQGPSAGVDPNILNSGEVFAPYESTQYEVGGRVSFGRFNASVALFQTELPSAYTISTPTATNPNALTFGIFGTQRNRGIEFSVDGEITRGLRVIAGGSILDAELRETAGGLNEGNRATGVPDYLLNANVEWDLPFARGLTLTGRVVHTGEQQVNQANTLQIPSWTRFDLGARYVALLGERPVTFRAGVDNVANEAYWASAFSTFGTQLLQGTPRTFKLSASIDF